MKTVFFFIVKHLCKCLPEGNRLFYDINHPASGSSRVTMEILRGTADALHHFAAGKALSRGGGMSWEVLPPFVIAFSW